MSETCRLPQEDSILHDPSNVVLTIELSFDEQELSRERKA